MLFTYNKNKLKYNFKNYFALFLEINCINYWHTLFYFKKGINGNFYWSSLLPQYLIKQACIFNHSLSLIVT